MTDRPTIVFDLDGTLVDTAPDLIATLNHMFEGLGLAPMDLPQARPLIGHGVRPLLEQGLRAHELTLASADVDALYGRYLDHYAAHIADASRPFPGVTAAMDALTARGARLAVCTNKLEWLSRKLLAALQLADRFEAICGQDTFAVRKPDPGALIETIRSAQGDPAHAVMVGDSATDINTARAAGIPVVAVDFGYTTVPVRDLSPDLVISHFDALPGAVAALLGRG